MTATAPSPRSVAVRRPAGRLALAALSAFAALAAACSDAPPTAPGPPPPTARVERGLAYGPDTAQRLDVYFPAQPEPRRPAVLLLHGGGWRAGSRADVGELAQWLADRGYVAIAADYRLVTNRANRFPVQLDDVQRAVRFLRASAPAYGVDPERLCAFGISAGGHLAALLGSRDTREGGDTAYAAHPSRVRCVIGLFPPTDLTAPFPVVRDSSLEAQVVALIGQPRDAAPALYRDASPVVFVDARSAASLLFHGVLDALVPVEQSRRFHAALRAQGVASTYVEFPDEGHRILDPRNDERFRAEIAAFLARQLGG